MPFTEHQRTESPVHACQLLLSTQQDIADELSSNATIGRLADWTVKLNDLNGCQEHVFRYQNSTEWHHLNMTNWLVRLPNGDLRVMTHENFVNIYSYCGDDYVIPEENRKTFEQAMIEFLNKYHPELYLNNQQPVITPYKNIVPTSAFCSSENAVITIEGSAVVIGPAHPANDKAEVLDGLEVVFTVAAPTTVTKILVSQVAGSYNAPLEWAVQATNSSTNETRTINMVSASMDHPGYYSSTDDHFKADTFKFTFGRFEYPDQFVDNFMIAVTTGGKFVEGSAEPTPLTELSEPILNLAAEALSAWYDPSRDVFTVNLPTMGIVSAEGLARIFPFLARASFIKDTTHFALNFSNNGVNPETGQYPNIFITSALQEICFEIHKLPIDIRKRIIEINFASVDSISPSAVANSVTVYTDDYWNDFVKELLTITSSQQPGQIRK